MDIFFQIVRNFHHPLVVPWHYYQKSYLTEVYLTTLFGKIFCFSHFFFGTGRDRRDGTDGTDRQTNKQTYGQTDFSRKILF